MTFRFLLTVALTSWVCSTVSAEVRQYRTVGERLFERNGSRWVQVERDGSRFAVDPGVITVKFAGEVSIEAQAELVAEFGAAELRRALTGWVDLRIADRSDPLDVVENLIGRPEVAHAEVTTVGEYAVMPDDTLYGNQWHLPQVEAEEAWDMETGAPGAVIAVLDSGTEFDHVDLGTGADAYQNVWLNPGEDAWSDPDDPTTGNGLDDDSNGHIDDWKGWDFPNNDNDASGPFFHGTAVAGVASAKTNNATGVAGVGGGLNGPGLSLLLVGVGDSAPSGAILDDAVLYAADLGANVVQLSLTVGQSAAIDDAMEMAYDTFGMVIVCSSGNGGGSAVGYPSSNEHIISVGSTGMTDLRTSTSQFGVDLEVAAPGEGIWTTSLNDGYTSTGGTSFSSPLTSGIVGLVLSANPNLTNEQIRQLLHDTADKVGPYDYNWNAGMPGHSQELGYGRVNARRAVEAAGGDIFTDGFESGDTVEWSTTVD